MRRQFGNGLNRRMSAASQLAVAALTWAAAAGCGGGNNNGNGMSDPADMSVLPPDLIGADLKDSTYPAGPYASAGGVNQGDVLPDFTFQGYWSPKLTTGKSSTLPFGEITFGMLHDSGAKYAVLDLTAFW